jgi:hypothetical protein
MPQQRQQPGEAGEPSRVNGDFGISPHSLSPKQQGSPVSVGTVESRGTSAAAAHIGGYDSESVRDLYTSERSPTADIAKPGSSSPLSDMLYFDDDDNDLDGIHVDGQVQALNNPRGRVIDQLRESELPPTQPFTVPRDMEPIVQDLVVEPSGNIEHFEEFELDGMWSISEEDPSDSSNRDESYYPSGAKRIPLKKQKKPLNRKTARKKPSLESPEAPAKGLEMQSVKGRPKASASQGRGSKTTDTKSQPRSNMARRIYAGRATQSSHQQASDMKTPATQPVPATFPQHKSSTTKVPKKSFLNSDEILAEDSHDADVEPKLKKSGTKTRDGTSSAAGSRSTGQVAHAISPTGNTASASGNIPQVDFHSSEYFSQSAAAPTVGSRKAVLPRTRSKKTNSSQREDPKTTSDARRSVASHAGKSGTLPTQVEDPFEIEVSPEPHPHSTSAKGRKVADSGGKKNSNPAGVILPTFSLDDLGAPEPKRVAGSNLKKKRSPVGYGLNSGKERMTRRSEPEKHQDESGVVQFDHQSKPESPPQQQPRKEEHANGELTLRPEGSYLSENINDDFPPLNASKLVAKRGHEKGTSKQTQSQDTAKTKGQKNVLAAQADKTLGPSSKKRRISDASMTPVRPIEEIDPPTPEAVRQISVNITGSPMALNLRQSRATLQTKSNASNRRHSKGRPEIVTIPDDTSSSSRVSASPTPVLQQEEKSVEEDRKVSEGILEKAQSAPITSKKVVAVSTAKQKSPVSTENVSTCPMPNYPEQLPRQPLVEAKQQPAVPEVEAPGVKAAPHDPKQLPHISLLPLEAQHGHHTDVEVPSNQQLGLETRSIWKELHHPNSIFLSARGIPDLQNPSSVMYKLIMNLETQMGPNSTPFSHSRSQHATQEAGTQYYSATSGSSGRPQSSDPSVHPKTHEFARKIMQRAYSQIGTRQKDHHLDSDQTAGEGQSRDEDTPLTDKQESMELWQKAIDHAQSGLADSMHGVTSVSICFIILPYRVKDIGANYCELVNTSPH